MLKLATSALQAAHACFPPVVGQIWNKIENGVKSGGYDRLFVGVRALNKFRIFN